MTVHPVSPLAPFDGQAEQGLRRYVDRIAGLLGIAEHAAWCEYADHASAYIALDTPPPGSLTGEVALLFDVRHGWALIVENGGEPLRTLAWHGHEPLPEPEAVAAFTRAVLAGQAAGTTTAPQLAGTAALAGRLRDYNTFVGEERSPQTS